MSNEKVIGKRLLTSGLYVERASRYSFLTIKIGLVVEVFIE